MIERYENACDYLFTIYKDKDQLRKNVMDLDDDKIIEFIAKGKTDEEIIESLASFYEFVYFKTHNRRMMPDKNNCLDFNQLNEKCTEDAQKTLADFKLRQENESLQYFLDLYNKLVHENYLIHSVDDLINHYDDIYGYLETMLNNLKQFKNTAKEVE